jgi:transposase InsO family protein
MKLHGNARTCPHSRSLIVRRVEEEGWSLARAAVSAGVSERTAAKWLARWRAEGERGLADRSSTPRRIPHRTPASRVQAIVALRRVRMTAAEIAELLSMALSTVSAILKRVGLGRLSRLAPPEPANRYERRGAGELLHVDVKKLGRIARPGHRISGRSVRATPGYHRQVFQQGWEYVHVCVDDATRLASVEVLADERGETAAAFLERAVAWYEGEGVRVERVMTDNGSAYRSRVHAEACARLGLRHLTTRPYRPRTNGKAERFIRTLLAGWAYARLYGSSAERTGLLSAWLDHYNWRRPHGSLSHRPPGARLRELNNLARSYS